jgi:pyrimidine operon attenuation protein/uracil phosphoribosyltransferase
MMKLDDIPGVLDDMATALSRHLERRGVSDFALVGIHTGGMWIARALQNCLGHSEPVGGLDISFYRDDFTRIGLHPRVQPSSLPFEVENRHVVLVDDVLYTGRTIRAALNEIFDYGRPASVTLVVLVDRGGRELPIAADVVGIEVTLAADNHIKLSGPDPLSLNILQDP